MELIDNIKKVIGGIEKDVEKFEKKDNKAAAVRIRKGLIEVINLSRNARKRVQEIKNNF